MTSAPTASMSSALSSGNGRGMPTSSTTVFFSVLTTKHPLRGLVGLMTTVLTPAPARKLLSFSARVLNAFQLLQACIHMRIQREDAACRGKLENQ